MFNKSTPTLNLQQSWTEFSSPPAGTLIQESHRFFRICWNVPICSLGVVHLQLSRKDWSGGLMWKSSFLLLEEVCKCFGQWEYRRQCAPQKKATLIWARLSSLFWNQRNVIQIWRVFSIMNFGEWDKTVTSILIWQRDILVTVKKNPFFFLQLKCDAWTSFLGDPCMAISKRKIETTCKLLYSIRQYYQEFWWLINIWDRSHLVSHTQSQKSRYWLDHLALKIVQVN